MFDAKEVSHTCVDIDTLVESTKARYVEVDEIKRLQNPLLNRLA